MINVLQTFRFPAGIWAGIQCGTFQTLKPNTKLVALYLWTASTGNKLGVYHLCPEFISSYTNLSLQEAKKSLAELIQIDFCLYDEEYHQIWVKGFLDYQIKFPLNCEAFRRHVRDLLRWTPPMPFLRQFYENYPKLIEYSPESHADFVKDLNVPTA